MGRYFIHMAYNGAAYCGWQTQPELPTVQLTLEQALSTLLRQDIAVVGCGRTDTGVHASDFFAHFDLKVPKAPKAPKAPNDLNDLNDLNDPKDLKDPRDPIAPKDLVFKLNNILPPDIAIFDIFPVADNAHARFDATARTYQYHVSDCRLPFRQGQYCRIYYKPDLEKMNEAAKVLMQYDDFTSFAKLHTQVKTNICHLTEAHWDEVPLVPTDGSSKSGGQHEWVFTIRSNRFLRNMVRSVTGTLLDVGRGKLTIDGLREIIEKKDRCAAGVSMPACGLFLTKVEYPYL